MIPAEHQASRPWTVVVLSLWSAVGLIWAVLFSDGWQISDLIALPFSIALIKGYWTGQSWAFHLTFAGTVLCGILLILDAIFDPGGVSLTEQALAAVTLVGIICLLRHPATKRFIRVDERLVSAAPSGPPDRGGRAVQALAVLVFGILAVALPLLWALGHLGGVWLLIGVVVCVGSGIWVMWLGMPVRRRAPPRSAP